MASFFKRAVTAALERREEVQDQNIVLQEKAVEENLDRLKKVEELRLKRNKALKDYKKYMPMIQSAAMKADSGISSVPEPLVLNLLQQSGGDPYIAARAAEKMAKAGIIIAKSHHGILDYVLETLEPFLNKIEAIRR